MKIINVDDLVGIRYKNNGRDKNGYDCYGLAIEVCKRFGNNLPDISEMNFDNEARRKQIVASLNVKEKKIPSKEGDVLLINNSLGQFSHIGVYLGDEKFIHCNLFGVHVDKIREYEKRIARVYEWL